jgi:hypothetical protein
MDLKEIIKHAAAQSFESSEYVNNDDLNRRLDDGDINGYELLLRKPNGEEQNISPLSAILFTSDLPTYRDLVKDDIEITRNEILNIDELATNASAYDRLLSLVKHKATVIPFVGAGFSVASGCPTWSDYIVEQAVRGGMNKEVVEQRLKDGDHEALMDEVIDCLGLDMFQRDFRSQFEGGRIAPALSPSTELVGLFDECYITTNFDRVLEHSHRVDLPFEEKVVGNDDTGRFLKAIYRSEKYLLKLHGNIDEQRDRILTQEEYNSGYGESGIDSELPIPRTLQRIFNSFTVLFVGCSLVSDRYLDVLKEAYELAPNLMPDHFAILVAPEDETEFLERDQYLASCGITPIWFTQGDWDKPAEILKLLKLEK